MAPESAGPPNPTSIRGPRPLYSLILCLIASTILSYSAYLIFGCSQDWVVVSGLLLNICGAVFLAVVDIPGFSRYLYVKDLERAYDDLFRTETPDIYPEEKIHDVIRSSVEEYTDLATTVEFNINEDEECLEIQNKGKQVPDENIGLPIFEYRLEEQIDREENRLRQSGLILLVIGFSVQFLGMVIDGFNFFNQITAIVGLTC